MESGSHFDSSRAELFEALGHPTRVKILRTLETKPMGFAELKREVGIESSGHLQFHLGKLAGLVTTNAEGSYTLTDDGREAIRVLKASATNSEQLFLVSKAPKRQLIIGIVLIVLGIFVALLGVAIVGSSWYLCPMWESNLSGCLHLAGPSVSSPPNSLYWGQWPPLLSIVLLVSGIAVVVVSVVTLPRAAKTTLGLQT
jgi:DNA-binding HxlR family transcriptional regulator